MNALLEVSVSNGKIDLLDRDAFVEKMLWISKLNSENKRNVCYAINGPWGIGKSFVLDLFEEKAVIYGKEGEIIPRYSVFRYNCWEYDYYEEPLIALVAFILDQVEERTHLIPENIRTTFVETLKNIGKSFLKTGINVVDEKAGGVIKPIIETINEGVSNSKQVINDNNDFDDYFQFKRILKKLQEIISKLAKDQTLIFIVDELDRCLPEYSIKVLERLHHIFEGVSNVQLIIAVDKAQFGRAINRIYGDQTDVDKYLAKFIDFELSLDEGYFNEETEGRFNYYLQNFAYISESTLKSDVDEFLDKIFCGLDMRTRIKIIDKCNLLHNMLNKDGEKKDFAFMCIEVAFVVMKYWNIDLFATQPQFIISNIFNQNYDQQNGKTYTGLAFLNGKVQKDSNDRSYYVQRPGNFENPVSYVRRDDIWGVILSSYRYVVGYTRDNYSFDDGYPNYGFRSYSANFKNLLYTIS